MVPEESDEKMLYWAMIVHLFVCETACKAWSPRPHQEQIDTYLAIIESQELYRLHPYSVYVRQPTVTFGRLSSHSRVYFLFQSFIEIIVLTCTEAHLQGTLHTLDDYLFWSERTLIDYCKRVRKEIWTPKKLFAVPIELQTMNYCINQMKRGLDSLKDQLACFMYCAYRRLNSPKMELLYSITALRTVRSSSRDMYPLYFLDAIIPFLSQVIELLITSCNFKLTDHLLAIAMFHCVKLQHLVPADALPRLNNAKGQLSMFFAEWGVNIYERSHYALKKIDMKWKFKINAYDFEEYPGMVEPGVEVYASQFPHNIISDLSRLKLISKKVKKWNDRALEFITDSSGKQMALDQRTNIYKLIQKFTH